MTRMELERMQAPGATPITEGTLQEAHDVDIQDCNSDALEMLEDEAEAEDEDEEELDRLVDEASRAFPEEKVGSMLKELRQEGLVQFMRSHVTSELNISALLVALGVLLPRSLRSSEVPRPLLISILNTVLHRFLQRREKLEQYNTLEDALCLLRTSQNIIVLSGAGISTSCGIPDFRSPDGLYARLRDSGLYDLDAPEDMFDKDVFLHRPEVFYSFAKDIYPSNFTPSPSHRFIKLLEDRGALLRDYTQNIDTLEQAVGISKVLNCHGSFATASCVTCGYQCPGAGIKNDVFAQRVPPCPECSRRKALTTAAGKKRKRSQKNCYDSGFDEDETNDTRRDGILKPDITFFGEKLNDDFDCSLLEDRSKASLLLVMGTSLKVAPVSSVVGHLPHSCPVILINRTPILHIAVDIMLLGDADIVVQWLCQKLGWKLPASEPDRNIVGQDSAASVFVQSISSSLEELGGDCKVQPKRVGQSHIWLFPGAEPGPLVSNMSERDNKGADGSEHSDDTSDPLRVPRSKGDEQDPEQTQAGVAESVQSSQGDYGGNADV